MKESFAPLQRAFDEQNADIAMVNLSLSSYGFMLSTSLIGDSNFRPKIRSQKGFRKEAKILAE
jgi:hypothetical protein